MQKGCHGPSKAQPWLPQSWHKMQSQVWARLEDSLIQRHQPPFEYIRPGPSLIQSFVPGQSQIKEFLHGNKFFPLTTNSRAEIAQFVSKFRSGPDHFFEPTIYCY